MANPKPTPRRLSAVAVVPIELLQDARFATRQQSWTIIGHANLGRIASDVREDIDWLPGAYIARRSQAN